MYVYDTKSRLQIARDHADQLALDMRRSRALTPDGAGDPVWRRLGAALTRRADRLLHRGNQQPAYGG